MPSNDSLVSAYGKMCSSLIGWLATKCLIDYVGNGVDYNSTPINATFVVGSTNATINVPVTRDSILEQSETFRLNLIIPASIRGRIHPGSSSTATGNISDSNGKTICKLSVAGFKYKFKDVLFKN